MPFRRGVFLLSAALIVWASGATGAGAQSAPLCEHAREFLVDDFAMLAEVEPETIADARTAQVHSGCRITAAGGTALTLTETAALLYEQLGATGWTRTPDPRDVPARGVRRMRIEGVDCLFAVYKAVTETIGTGAQLRVNRAFHPLDQDEMFNVIVQCVPPLAAAK